MNKFIILCIFVFSSYTYNYAQSDSLVLGKESSLRLDSVEIRGNKITKDFVILRELTIKTGDIVNGRTVDYNSERVFSLGLFNKVLLYFKQSINPERNILVIDVEESWYIYPIPFIRLRDKDLGQASYGLYVIYKNFRGRNEEIKGKIELGYDPVYNIEYYNPLLIESMDISFATSLTYQKVLNRSDNAENLYGEEFSYLYRKINFIFGKRINPFNMFFLNFGYTYIDIPAENNNNILAGNSNIDRVFSTGLSYVFDTRDLKQYPESGIYGTAVYNHNGFGFQDIDYNVFYADYRQYQKIVDKLILKWRTSFRHTFGAKIPFYDMSFFGAADYVRGNKFNEREGNNYSLSSIELVQPLIKNWNISLDLPVLPRKLTSARVELYLSGFVDTGIIFNNTEKININNFDTGYGLGLTILILPFNAIRVEYAFNEFKKSELIIGTGFSF